MLGDPFTWPSRSLGALEEREVERHVNRAANPKLGVGVTAIDHSPRVKTVPNMPLGGRVAETRFDCIAVLANGPGVIDTVVGEQNNISA